MVAATAFHQLAQEHALVDQVDRRAAQHQPTVRKLRVARVRDHRLQAVGAKIFLEQDELAVGRHLAPVEDGDARAAYAAPRAVRGEQPVQHPVPGGEWPDVEATEELPHHGQGQEDLGQRISVRRAGRRLGVVLGDLQHALVR